MEIQQAHIIGMGEVGRRFEGALARGAAADCAMVSTNPAAEYDPGSTFMVDVVVHVFHEKTREYYMLDRLWGDARSVDLGLDTTD